MASSLLDELPCLLDEADELMARLAFFMKLLPGGTTATKTEIDTSEASEELAKLRACLASAETESAFKVFAKQFLTSQPVPLEKMFALLPIQDAGVGGDIASSSSRSASCTLQSVAKRVFHLMKRVHHWQRTAWGILTQFFAESSYLMFDKHRLLAALLLDTLAKYVKVHLLWTSWRHAVPSLLALHTFAQFASSPSYKASVNLSATGPSDPSASIYSPLEHADHHLREYVLCFGSNPLYKIQQDFQQHPDAGEIARNLTALTLSCFESYVGCHDLEQLRNQGVFDSETFFLGSYAGLGVYEDLLFSRQQEDWVLCTALCLPQQLKAAPRNSGAAANSSGVQLWDFVHVVAQDRLVLPVFRDFAVNVHSALYQQIACALSGGGGGSGGLSSPPSSTGGQPSLKKCMSALSKQALRTCADHHLQRAQLVSWLLQGCSHLLTQNAALVAPLFPVLLGACRVARDEIEWLLSHDEQSQQLLLPAHVKSKHLHRVRASFTGNARVIGDLFAQMHRLRTLVQQNVRFVESYYTEFLAHGDADAIAFEIHALLSPPESRTKLESASSSDDAQPRQAVEPRVQQILSSFAVIERYRYVDHASTIGANSKPMTWRREWRQLSVVLLTITSAVLPSSFLKLMERACVHCKYVESSERLLSHHSQLSKWWWFAGSFEKTFLRLLRSRTGGASEAIAMLEIVHATCSGSYELDEVVEDLEAHEDALMMQALHRRMETAVGDQLEHAIDAVVLHEVVLHFHSAQQTPDAAGGSVRSSRADRSLHLTSSKSSEHRLPSVIMSMRSPKSGGSTSSLQPPGALERTAKADEALTALTAAVTSSASRADTTMRSRLTALVERHVRRCFVRFLRGLVQFASVSETTGSGAASKDAADAGSAMSVSLRCSLEQASFELQSYVRCVNRLFRNATFVDLKQVVVDALKSERQGGSVAATMPDARSDFSHDVNLVQRVMRLYLFVLQQHCAMPMSALVASRRTRGFVSQEQSRSTAPHLGHLTRCADLDALRNLRTVVGGSGIRALVGSVMHCVSRQVQTLRSALKHDEVALIWFGKAVDSGSPSSELAMAVKQMARLEEIVGQLRLIGLHLFFVELIRELEPPSDTPQLTDDNSTNAVEFGVECAGDRVWKLLPVAFAASFHSELWRRSKYLEALDAADSNAHMSATATLYLMQLVHEGQESVLLSDELGDPVSKDEDSEQDPAEAVGTTAMSKARHRVELRRAVFLSSQSALGLRAKAPQAFRAMLAAVRLFAEAAATTGGEAKATAGAGDTVGESTLLELGALDEWLPELVFQSARSS